MKVERRVHRTTQGFAYVRYHVTDDAGRCIPDACADASGRDGHRRRRGAERALFDLHERIRRSVDALG